MCSWPVGQRRQVQQASGPCLQLPRPAPAPPLPGLSPSRQDPLLARSAARYMRLTIPALFGQGVFEASKRYLLAQVRRP